MKRSVWTMCLAAGVLALPALTAAAEAAEKLSLGYLRGSSGAPIEVMKATTRSFRPSGACVW